MENPEHVMSTTNTDKFGNTLDVQPKDLVISQKSGKDNEVVSAGLVFKLDANNGNTYAQTMSCANALSSHQPKLPNKKRNDILFLCKKGAKKRKSETCLSRTVENVNKSTRAENMYLLTTFHEWKALLALAGILEMHGDRLAYLLQKHPSIMKDLKNRANLKEFSVKDKIEDERGDTEYYKAKKGRNSDALYKKMVMIAINCSISTHVEVDDKSGQTKVIACSVCLNSMHILEYPTCIRSSARQFSLDPKKTIGVPSIKRSSLSCKIRAYVDVTKLSVAASLDGACNLQDSILHLQSGKSDPQCHAVDRETQLMIPEKLRQVLGNGLGRTRIGFDPCEISTDEMTGCQQTGKVEPRFVEDSHRSSVQQEVENGEVSNALGEQTGKEGRLGTSEELISGHLGSTSGVGSGQSHSLIDNPSYLRHHDTEPKAIPDPRREIGEVEHLPSELQHERRKESVEGSPSEIQHDDDLRVDGESGSSFQPVHENTAADSAHHNSHEKPLADVMQSSRDGVHSHGTGMQSPGDLIQSLGDGAQSPSHDSLDAMSDDSSPPHSVLVHTPVTVSSLTSSAAVYYDACGYPDMPSEYDTCMSASVTDSSSHHHSSPRVVATPLDDPGFRNVNGVGHCDQIGARASVNSTAVQTTSNSCQPRATSSVDFEDFHHQLSSVQRLSHDTQSCESCYLQDPCRQTQALPSTQETTQHFDQTHSGNLPHVENESTSSFFTTSSTIIFHEALDDNSHNCAPLVLPPIRVVSAGALPSWAAQTPGIDLSVADNRPMAPLRVRRATYDSDWPTSNSGTDPANMALAGFYCLGEESGVVEGAERTVRCFYCGLELTLTSLTLARAHRVNIWDEHVRHCAWCPYLVFVMGEEMVQRTLDNLRRQPRD